MARPSWQEPGTKPFASGTSLARWDPQRWRFPAPTHPPLPSTGEVSSRSPYLTPVLLFRSPCRCWTSSPGSGSELHAGWMESIRVEASYFPAVNDPSPRATPVIVRGLSPHDSMSLVLLWTLCFGQFPRFLQKDDASSRTVILNDGDLFFFSFLFTD